MTKPKSNIETQTKAKPSVKKALLSWTDIEFKNWTERFDSLLISRTPAWRGLQKLIACNSDVFLDPLYSAIPDRRISCLFLIYDMTSIIDMPSSVIKSDERSRKRLERITADIESYVAYLRKVGPLILSTDGLIPMEMTPVLRAFESAAEVSRSFLTCLQRRYARFGDRVDFCLHFLNILNNNGIPEKEAYGLTQIAMEAHGYKPDEIELLNDTHLRDGTIRKRRNAFSKQMKEWSQVVERYRTRISEEQRRKLYSLPPQK
jgi:hypothetical protein